MESLSHETVRLHLKKHPQAMVEAAVVHPESKRGMCGGHGGRCSASSIFADLASIGIAGTAEPVLEGVVGLEFSEGPGALPPAVSQYPGHRQLGVVVEDALGHSAEEGEGRDVPIAEGLGGLRRIGLHEAPVAVGQVQDEAVGLLLHSADDHLRLPEVALGVARRMGQRDEHLLRPAAMLPHVVLDHGVLAVKPVLGPEPLEDPLGCVALLPGTPEVVCQDLVDDAGAGLLMSLSKGWDAGAESAASSPAARSRPASCARRPGTAQTSAQPPG